jgi:ParB family chromosome partitioning protein
MTELIKVKNLKVSPFNVRKDMGSKESELSMTDNVKELGILQDLVVRPTGNGDYEVVIGQNRLEAAKKAGLKSVPCNVRRMSDEEAVLASLSENLVRRDLTILDRANAIDQVLDQYGYTHQSLAKKLGLKNRSAIDYMLEPLKWQPETQERRAERTQSKHGGMSRIVGQTMIRGAHAIRRIRCQQKNISRRIL